MMTPFGTTSGGLAVDKITIGRGPLKVSILTWGAVVQSVRLDGVAHDLTLGSDLLADYEGAMRHHGALIGPVVNRIKGARARIGGMMYELERNQDGQHSLHSGRDATHLKVWDVVEVTDDSVTLAIDLIDGQCDLPGNRRITARFWVEGAALALTVTATTDEATLMNIANHSYWNLDGTPNYAGHRLWIGAERYLPTTPEFLPTGDIAEVAGTDMDFRAEREIAPHAPEFDTNYCLSEASQPLRDVLRLTGQSGVSMTIATTAPGIQVYDGRHAIRPGRTAYEGVAIEAQYWPDAPNNRDFPSIALAKGAVFSQDTRWTFIRA